LRSWTKRERAYKIPGVKTKRGINENNNLEDTEGR
jgi:hypothetical protein